MIVINWTSAGVILAAFSLLLAFVVWRQNQQRNQITDSVNALRDVLLEKLETKDNVTQIRIELTRVATLVDGLKAGINASKN